MRGTGIIPPQILVIICSYNIVTKLFPITLSDLQAHYKLFVLHSVARGGAAGTVSSTKKLVMCDMPPEEAAKLVNILIKWMIELEPDDRPVAKRLLECVWLTHSLSLSRTHKYTHAPARASYFPPRYSTYLIAAITSAWLVTFERHSWWNRGTRR
jgi:hypothetical protein